MQKQTHQHEQLQKECHQQHASGRPRLYQRRVAQCLDQCSVELHLLQCLQGCHLQARSVTTCQIKQQLQFTACCQESSLRKRPVSNWTDITEQISNLPHWVTLLKITEPFLSRFQLNADTKLLLTTVYQASLLHLNSSTLHAKQHISFIQSQDQPQLLLPLIRASLPTSSIMAFYLRNFQESILCVYVMYWTLATSDTTNIHHLCVSSEWHAAPMLAWSRFTCDNTRCPDSNISGNDCKKCQLCFRIIQKLQHWHIVLTKWNTTQYTPLWQCYYSQAAGSNLPQFNQLNSSVVHNL